MQKAVRGYIRRMVNVYLNSRCTVQYEIVGRGDYGQNAAYWSDVAENVPCRMLPAGQGDTERVADFAGQESINEIRRLVLAHDFALEVGQRMVIGDVIYYVASLEVNVTDEAYRSCVVVRKAGADG